ncbi:MAG TPA: MarR family transcriptional regulator [Acidimicrobiales bacterium]|nr:MarR family transcriptional regulator [Acidimicrobiales bacterium]
MAEDVASQLKDVADRLSAIGKEIAAREEDFERDMAELRQTRMDLARELQALTLALTGDVRPSAAVTRSARRPVAQRQSAEDREQQVLDLVRSNGDGLNGKEIAERLGVSTATATKTINALLERRLIRAEGARRNRKLLAT